MTSSSTLAASLKLLNPAQLQAVQATEGPVLVFAGPGTGKTQILTTRIATLLDQGVAPGNILALTFTNAGAKNMQERLAQLVGSTAYQVLMTTFHSFCAGVIEQHAHIFPVEMRSGGSLSELDQYELVRSLLEAGEFPHLKPPNKPLHHLRSAVNVITQYKREGVSPDQVRVAAREGLEALESEKLTAAARRKHTTLFQRNLDLALLYEQYQQALRERGQFDYEDMILWVRDALRNEPEITQEYQERFQYILVDEFQDTNQAQFQVLVALTSFWGPQANIFVVGDPNQSIYRFQGASVSNVLQFWKLFPDAQVITLDQGYRCPPELYQAAASLIQQNQLTDLDPRLSALEKPLQSQRSPGQAPVLEYRLHANPLAEALALAELLEAEHAKGTPWSEMAVLYRSHSQAKTAEWVLRRRGIPLVAQRGENSLDQPLVRAVIDIFELIREVQTNQDIERWVNVLLQPWWQFPKEEALRLLRVARKGQETGQGVWWWLEHEEQWAELNWKDPELWRQFRQHWITWQEELLQPVPVAIEHILGQAGVYRHIWNEPQWQAQLPFFLGFLRQAHQWNTTQPLARLPDFIQRLRAMEQHGFSLEPEFLATQPQAVTLSSAHSAKGREWTQVFLLQVNDTVWSNVSVPSGLAPLPNTIPYAETDEKEAFEDDRRLFYVAVTRAKEKVWLLQCQRDVRNGNIRELIQSPFVLELGITESPQEVVLKNEQDVLQQAFGSPADSILTTLDRGWVQGLVENFSLSYTALESYLGCSAEFFFRYLVRIPEVKQLPQVVGEAVHAGLELANRQMAETGTLPPLATIVERTRSLALGSPLVGAERAKAVKRATELIEPYIQSHAAQWPTPFKVEHFFGRTAPTIFEGLSLVGKVDAILVSNEGAKTVRVIDYKTGRRKTRAELVGKPEDLRRPADQVVFYALLAQLDSTFAYTVTEGVFEFLTPSDAGKYLPVYLEITPERMAALQTTLRQVRDELQSLEFLSKTPCGECEICRALGLEASLPTALIENTFPTLAAEPQN